MSRPIIMFDASAAKESACRRRLYFNIVEGWRTQLSPNDMEFGSAFHKFRKVWRDTGNVMEGIKAACDHMERDMVVKYNKKYLTPQYLSKVCIDYALTYAKDDFEKLPEVDARELRFSLPLYCDDNVEILSSGTIDEVGKIVNGAFCVVDTKTTSVGEDKRDNYLEDYAMDAQLKWYVYHIRRHAKLFPQSFIGKLAEKNVGAMIDGVFLHGKDAFEFKRSRVFFFDDRDLNELEVMIMDRAKLIAEMVKTGTWPYREGCINNACKTIYGSCKYFNVCNTSDDIAARHVLKNNFVQVRYNPLTFGE